MINKVQVRRLARNLCLVSLFGMSVSCGEILDNSASSRPSATGDLEPALGDVIVNETSSPGDDNSPPSSSSTSTSALQNPEDTDAPQIPTLPPPSDLGELEDNIPPIDSPVQQEPRNPAPLPLVWKKADLTHYESYPDPGSEECILYSGCQWAGMFAALNGKQTESWVKAHNIIAVHSKDFKKYKLKTLRLKKGSKTIDAKVYDMCADTDCDGCCTKNSKATGFLIDVEKYTKARFGGIGSGIIEWTCLDCL